MGIARWVPNKQFIEALDGITKNYKEVSGYNLWGIDSRSRYYGSKVPPEAVEGAVRRYLGPDALRRLQSWGLEGDRASAAFLEDKTLKQPAFRSKVRNWQKRISFYPAAPSDRG